MLEAQSEDTQEEVSKEKRSEGKTGYERESGRKSARGKKETGTLGQATLPHTRTDMQATATSLKPSEVYAKSSAPKIEREWSAKQQQSEKECWKYL